MLEFECQKCGECCKKYYVVSLPSEVKKQAIFLKIAEEKFIAENLQLYLQIFPYSYNEKKPIINSNLLPKKYFEEIEEHEHSEHYMVLPLLAFKRKKSGFCAFFDENSRNCKIYSTRPLECILFPLVSEKSESDNKNHHKLYPFCIGFGYKSKNLSYMDFSKIHFKQMSDYFIQIMSHGFTKVWKTWPKEGTIVYKNKKIGTITEKEFFEIIEPFK